MKRTTIRRAVVSAGLVATAATAVLGAAATGSAAAPAQGKDDLAVVRAATAKYHDVDVATAHGYIPVSPCEQLPGAGAMGVHYLHPGLASDAEIDPAHPELLLYAPTADGMTLVAVEYFVASAAVPAGVTPSVLGRPMDGPMAGHSPEMPEHYDLHVWLWKHNPAGMTAPWNPALSCTA